MFLAAVGTRSGEAFAASAFTVEGAKVVVASIAVVATAVLVLRWTVGRVAHLEGPAASGAVAGLQTQPAVLAFADTSSGHSPQVPLGYTALYPRGHGGQDRPGPAAGPPVSRCAPMGGPSPARSVR